MSSILYLTSAVLLCGQTDCPLEEWGANRGSVCEGEEVDFGVLAKGKSLSGWWEREAGSGELSGVLDETRWYLLFDDEDRPRAWTSDSPSEYSKEIRYPSSWAFGCEDFMDHPLVVGGETRSPSSARNTMGNDGCGRAKVAIDGDSRRVLLDASYETGELCLDYHVLNNVMVGFGHDSSEKAPTEEGRRKTICFNYWDTSDILQVSVKWGSGEPDTSVYRRFVPKKEEGEDEALAGVALMPTGVKSPSVLGGRPQ